MKNKQKIINYLDEIEKRGLTSYFVKKLSQRLKYREIRNKSLLYVGIILLWLVSLSVALYMGYSGYFKDEISNIINLPEINNTINNQFDFNPKTDNKFDNNNDFKIYNNIFIDGENICDLCNSP